MSAVAAPAPGQAAAPGAPIPGGPPAPKQGGRSKTRKIVYGIAIVYVLGLVVFGLVFGVKSHRNESFDVVGAFHLESWFHIAGPLNFDKGVLYLLMAASITVGIVLWTSKRMQMRPGRLQTVVEWIYDLSMRMTRDNMDEEMARRWFPLVFTLFVFILVTNLIGYIPLPVNSGETFKVFGVAHPVVPDLCRRHQPRDPAAAGARRVHRLQRRRHPSSRVRRLHQEPRPVRDRRRHADLHVSRWRSCRTSCACSR